MHACLARAGVGGLGGPASFTLTLPALERTPQSSFPLPHPLAWNPQLGRWALLARRGAAGEVASRELGTSMGQGLGHRLWLSNICPALIRVRKLLGPLPHAPQIGRRERGSGDRKQAGVKGGGRWYSGPLTDASTVQTAPQDISTLATPALAWCHPARSCHPPLSLLCRLSSASSTAPFRKLSWSPPAWACLSPVSLWATHRVHRP